MNHGEKAEKLFKEGFNCAQSVLCAFEDVTGFERETAMREVCGAVSGAAMVLGLAKGYSDPGDFDAKKAHYALIQEFAARFKEQNGSIICRELLSGSGASSGFTPERRTDGYYQKRPCAELCRCAAEIVEGLLTEI